MKKLIITSILALLFAGGSNLTAQNWQDEYLGLPGDNLNLFAVMNLFQESETLEGFERSLNDPDQMINNLDLNGDNYVDYIMVFDYVEGNVHTIVLRVALNQREYQDVAVFTVEKFRDGSVQVQLIGDEALYGPNYIVEPNYAETPNPGYRGNVTQAAPRNVTVVRTTYYEVAHWPVIVYISRPVYRPWRSVYYYGYYPVYWRPWTPHYWHFYYGYHYNWHSHYYAYYRPWRHHRCGYYHTGYYTGIRNYSPVVIVNINKGTYKNTYSRPDTRKQGEVLYTQRHGSGSTTGRNATVNRGAGRNSTQEAASANSARAARQENTARTSAATSPARTNANAARQSAETGRRQEATVNTSRDNREQAVQSNAARQTTAARPAAEAPRNQSTRVTNSRNNTGTAVQNNAAPRRETSTAPARNVSAPAPDRSRAATQSAPARVSPNRSESGNSSSSAVRTQPARTNSQPSGNVSSSSRNNSNRNSGTSVQRSGSNSRNSGTSVQRSGSSNNQRSAPARESGSRTTPQRR